VLCLAIDCGPMEERATRAHSNALSGTSGSGIVAGQKKAADLTGLPVPIISKLVDGLMRMAGTNIDKRSRLLSAAVELTYQNGFEATSLADIAREAKVPLGNVYYYFKTKDEIGEAIVELRLAQLSAQRQRWNEAGSPKDRLCACVQGVFENKDCLAQLGCQVGTFCSELHKAGGPVATRATEIFAQHLAWIESQFRALGKGKDSNGLAVHLLSAMQGVSVLAHTFHDSGLVARETKRLKSWIESL
jgi:AcrR family transcriptional regulator